MQPTLTPGFQTEENILETGVFSTPAALCDVEPFITAEDTPRSAHTHSPSRPRALTRPRSRLLWAPGAGLARTELQNFQSLNKLPTLPPGRLTGSLLSPVISTEGNRVTRLGREGSQAKSEAPSGCRGAGTE